MRLAGTPSSPATKSRSTPGMPLSNSMRITEPRRRRFSAVSKRRTRSSASSSTSMSLSRMRRNVPEPLHLVAREQLADEQADRLLERDEADQRLAVRQPDEALQRHRQAQQRRHLVLVLEVLQLQRDRKAEIGNERERVRRVDRQRRQHRKHRIQEMLFQPGQLVLGQRVGLDALDAFGARAGPSGC